MVARVLQVHIHSKWLVHTWACHWYSQTHAVALALGVHVMVTWCTVRCFSFLPVHSMTLLLATIDSILPLTCIHCKRACWGYLFHFLPIYQEGRNALHLAARHGHLEVVQYLLPIFGDKRFSVTRSGETCMSLARRKGHQEVVRYLLEEGGFKSN